MTPLFFVALSIVHCPLSIFFVPSALAATPPTVVCGNLPGCGSPIMNVVGATAIPELARILLNLTAALSIIFVLIGGARYLLGFGKEEEYEKAKKSILWALAGLLIALLSDEIVAAIITERYVGPICTGPGCTLGGGPVLDILRTAVRIMMVLLNVTFLLVIIASGMRMVTARGKEEEISKARHMVIYAIVGVVVINAAPYVVKAVLALF